MLSDIRVDIPSIRNLLSVTSYQSLANQKPDGVLYARTIGFGSSESNQKFTTSNSRLGRLKKFEKATGYNVSKKSQTKILDRFSGANKLLLSPNLDPYFEMPTKWLFSKSEMAVTSKVRFGPADTKIHRYPKWYLLKDNPTTVILAKITVIFDNNGQFHHHFFTFEDVSWDGSQMAHFSSFLFDVFACTLYLNSKKFGKFSAKITNSYTRA